MKRYSRPREEKTPTEPQLGPKHHGRPTTNRKGQPSSPLPSTQHDLMTLFTRTGTDLSEQEPHRGPLPLTRTSPLPPPWRLFPDIPSTRRA